MDQRDYFKTGGLLVAAKPASGPHADMTIMVMTPRDEFVLHVQKCLEASRAKRRLVIRNTCAAIKQALLDPHIPTRNGDLMDDIAILMTLLITDPPNVKLAKARLLQLGLIILPDESLPWHERGMLDPALTRKLNLNTTPQLMGKK